MIRALIDLATIRSDRSAIASCYQGFEDGLSLTMSHVLSKICKSLLKRPPVKSLLLTWSLPAVHRRLSDSLFEPISKTSLHDITLKVLVAITSGQRVSALQLCVWIMFRYGGIFGCSFGSWTWLYSQE